MELSSEARKYSCGLMVSGSNGEIGELRPYLRDSDTKIPEGSRTR